MQVLERDQIGLIPRYFDTNFITKEMDGIGSKIFFEEWPFEKIWNDNSCWSFDKLPMYLYVLSNTSKSKNLHAHVGCVHDIKHRYLQHNGKISGGPTETRKGAGDWHIVIILRFPPIRNYTIKDIRNGCRSKRGHANRYENVLKIAQEMNLEYFISPELLNEKSVLYIKQIADYIYDLEKRGKFNKRHNLLPHEFVLLESKMKQMPTRKRQTKNTQQETVQQESKKRKFENISEEEEYDEDIEDLFIIE